MEIYTFMNQKYEEQQRTGKSSIKFPNLNVKSELKNYLCGHPVKAVIINTTEESLSTYFEWKKSKTTLCLSCWNIERGHEYGKK